MAFLEVKNVRIAGIAACAPKHIEDNLTIPVFREGEAERVIAQTGIKTKHTVVDNSMLASDMAVAAAETLMERLQWEKSSIDALCFVSLSSDYPEPPTACILQDRLGLPEDCMTIDINQGCSGWVNGLSVLSTLVSTGNIKRALLLNGDTSSLLCSPFDKESRPLFGDGSAATALEYDENAKEIYFNFGTRGSDFKAILTKYRFLLVCLENHLNVSATEVMALIEQLKEKYPIDPSRIYASGFSMGGCKSWDLFQEYPESFAALAPMDATFEVGLNLYGQPAPKPINRDIPVPLYYAAGEKTPLPEMPCQADKCMERARYVFEVNRVAKAYDLVFDDRANWEEPFWGVPGDRIEKIPDLSREAVLTEHHYLSTDGVCRTVFAGVDNQGHECREHTCEQAWQFMKDFTR